MSDIYLQITETPTVVTLSAPVVSGALASTVTVANTVTVALDSNSLSALENVTVTVGAAITGTVTVSNFPATQPVSIASVTIGNTVTIAGTVTANNSTLTNVLQYDGSHYFLKVGGVATTGGTSFPVYVAGTVTANPTGTQTIAGTVTAQLNYAAGSAVGADGGDNDLIGIRLGYNNDIAQEFQVISENNGLPIQGTVTASISNSVTIGSLPAISGTVTANIGLNVAQSLTGGSSETQPPSAVRIGWSGEELFYGVGVDAGGQPLPIQIYLGGTAGENVTTANPLPIAGTVTANSSNGSLTTRFGSVTTANTAFATSAVTNANRKYLLIQNVTTASNVITVGIGFTPTTTQGIQLFAGAGLTFEGSYIPTGAVNLLSSVTASCYTILEA